MTRGATTKPNFRNAWGTPTTQGAGGFRSPPAKSSRPANFSRGLFLDELHDALSAQDPRSRQFRGPYELVVAA